MSYNIALLLTYSSVQKNDIILEWEEGKLKCNFMNEQVELWICGIEGYSTVQNNCNTWARPHAFHALGRVIFPAFPKPSRLSVLFGKTKFYFRYNY